VPRLCSSPIPADAAAKWIERGLIEDIDGQQG
jgi:hypothetical protein